MELPDRAEDRSERPDAPFCSSSCSTGNTSANPVTLTSYSSPKAIPSPLNPLNLLNLLNPGRFAAPGRYHNPQPEGLSPPSTQPAVVRRPQPAPSGAPPFSRTAAEPPPQPTGPKGPSPFGGWRHHLSPASGGTIKRRGPSSHSIRKKVSLSYEHRKNGLCQWTKEEAAY